MPNARDVASDTDVTEASAVGASTTRQMPGRKGTSTVGATPETIGVIRDRVASLYTETHWQATEDIRTLLAWIDRLTDGIKAIEPARLAGIETQMQVSCRAAATVWERKGQPRRAEQERAMVPIHKETARALRALAEIEEE